MQTKEKANETAALDLRVVSIRITDIAVLLFGDPWT
jgi:hypothetical protein